ncbi:RNA polymerase sigma factor [Erythrobacter sp. NFXS35]|uniref:RNA polymerase sigma factor n=1 Tax=Erythrobacter sp. NFXS35 TaxID=2818436 RepID=UPI0032DF5DBB
MSPPDEDAALVTRALAGDAQAQRALVERHRDAIYRLARSATGDADEALDIVQETFLSAFDALKRYDPARPLRSWLATIALNKARDWMRRQKVRRFLKLAVPENAADWIRDDAPLPDEVAQQRDALAATALAVAALPANLKDVLLLRTLEEMSQSETALALGITEKAVETRLYRARQKLGAVLRDDPIARV